MDVIADIEGHVFAYRDGALVIVVRGINTSPFGRAYEPVRQVLIDRCHTLVVRGPNQDTPGGPEWALGAEVSIFKVWAVCPPYEHECAEVVENVAS